MWPAATRELHSLAPAGGSLEQLLQVLWWLKTYPTEEVLRNKGVSPYHFRINLWARLHALNNQLPEVLFWFVFASSALKQGLTSAIDSFPFRIGVS